MERIVRFFGLMLLILLLSVTAWAVDEERPAVTQPNALLKSPSQSVALTDAQPKLVMAEPLPNNNEYLEPLTYTLGPEDTIEINVMRHPEFSGVFPVNLEGKIQYKFVGDIEITGLTKKELEQKLKQVISAYVINPGITVTILEYKSKVIYVLGEVGQPGKYNMKADVITVREAVVNAGLPTLAAAMRKCRIITPDKDGKAKVKSVDLYTILYGGNLKYNYEMKAGDVLYVPSTVMAKLIRVINPVTATVSGAAAGPSSASSGKTAITNLAK